MLRVQPVASAVEQAIYGVLGGWLNKVLPRCSSWEDLCWLLCKNMLDEQIDHVRSLRTRVDFR